MDSRWPAIRRFVIYGAVVGSALAFLALTDNLPTTDEVDEFGEELGPFAVILFVPLFVAANFIITWPILAGAAGLLFGTALATPLVLIAVTVASLAQMAVARKLAGEHKGRLLPSRTRRVEKFLTDNGTVAVMQSRIVPFLPWGLVNFSAGVTHLPYRAMAIGTAIGAAPKVFAYTALGGNLDDLTSPEAFVAIGLLVVLALAGALFVRRQIRASPSPREAPGTRQPASGHPPG
jgi:uncharacterized membrane protein YdjX (TVP38/TMEM64 family)